MSCLIIRTYFPQESSDVNDTHVVSKYTIIVTKNPEATVKGSVIMLLTFSQPVDLQRVSFTGDVRI